MNYRPTKRVLHIMPAPSPHMTRRGLYIPETSRMQPSFGIVIKAGNKCQSKPGDRVDFLLGALEMNADGSAFIIERFCYLMFNGHKVKTKEMRVHDGWVIVKVPYITKDDALASAQSDEARNMITCRFGQVVSAPRIATNKYEPIVASYIDKDPRVDVKKGDKVFFSPYVINSIRDESYPYKSYAEIQVGEKVEQYIIIPYKELVCKYVGEKFTSLNGYAIASRVIPEFKKSVLITPSTPVKKDQQLDDFIMECDTFAHKKGDKIVFPLNASIETLESEYAMQLSKEYYFFKEDASALSYTNEEISFVLKLKNRSI